jgi:hypothetical protein
MAHVIVERSYESPVTDEQLEEAMARMGPCLQRYGVRWIRSFLSNDRRRDICEYEASDAEAVRMAHRAAHLPYLRVWTAAMMTPESVAASQAPGG